MITLNNQPPTKKLYNIVISSLSQSDMENMLAQIYSFMDVMESPSEFDIELYETTKAREL